ncbi:DUF937 domain-containing protein [Paludisphaera soli]|uniref:DUF937 domain-containing protein n=1 Tax=Paludisphaera soli TaxID=2712865 RepID=UPI0013EA4C2F|nr:DUF937 domain-containing protein [Paludisphaera soli]
MNLVDAIQDQISGEGLRKLAVDLDQSEDQARAATAAALPAVLASLSNQVLDGHALDALLRSLRERPEASAEPKVIDDSDLLGPALGANLPELIDLLARTTRLEPSAVRKLLVALGPVVLDTIAARARAEGGLDAEHLIHVFTAEKPKITGALPEGLSLADLPSIPGVPTTVTPAVEEGPAIPGWVLPALAVALVAASVWFLLKQPVEVPTAPESPASPKPRKEGLTPPPPPIERAATAPES